MKQTFNLMVLITVIWDKQQSISDRSRETFFSHLLMRWARRMFGWAASNYFIYISGIFLIRDGGLKRLLSMSVKCCCLLSG